MTPNRVKCDDFGEDSFYSNLWAVFDGNRAENIGSFRISLRKGYN
jgi:hypothetical protein